MAELTSKQRGRLSRKTFAIPGKKGESDRYPIPDLAHARNALARVSTHGTPEEKKKVALAVKRKFPDLAKRSAFVKQWTK